MKLFGGGPLERHEYELGDVVEEAALGRKLAIYDRKTQLYAYWYLQLRGEEEIARARRYGRALSLISAWAPTPEATAALAAHLRAGLRRTDLPGYLHNSHFVVLLTETGAEGGAIVLERIITTVGPGLRGAAVAYPDDGQSFDELLECAKARADYTRASRATSGASKRLREIVRTKIEAWSRCRATIPPPAPRFKRLRSGAPRAHRRPGMAAVLNQLFASAPAPIGDPVVPGCPSGGTRAAHGRCRP
jgi:GGDEF domain-containing protein